MNNLKTLKILIKPQHLIQSRSHTWYLTRRRVRAEVLEDDYKSPEKSSKIDLKKLDLMKRDRRIPVSWEKSIKYLESDVYKKAYRGLKVWMPYRRGMAGLIENPPRFTRNRCIVDGFVVVGSPCPICRDKNLVIHPRNIKLLEQFINPASDDVYPCSKVMLCEYTYEDLVSAVEIARDRGYLQFRVPFRQFEYEDFYSSELIKDLDLNDKLIDHNSVINKARNIINPTNQPYAKTLVPF